MISKISPGLCSLPQKCASLSAFCKSRSNLHFSNLCRKSKSEGKRNLEFPTSHEDSITSLLQWLKRNGGQFIERIGILQNGMFSTEKFKAGSNLLGVPTQLCFTRENLLSEGRLKCALSKHLPWPLKSRAVDMFPFYKHPEISGHFYEKDQSYIYERTIVALCLMHEYSLKMASDWGPWLSFLPDPPAINENSLFIGGPTLPYKYLYELRGSQAFIDILNMKIDFDGAWLWAQRIINNLPAEFNRRKFKRRFFDHFMMIAGHQYPVHPAPVSFVQCAKSLAMVNVKKRIYQTESLEGPIELVGLHSTRNIDAGEELLIEFNLPGSQTFARYGFAKPVFACDSFFIPLPLPVTDPSRLEKLRAIISAQIPSCRDISWNASLEQAYESGDTWRWYSEQCHQNSAELSPAGNHFSAEIVYEYPPQLLVGMCMAASPDAQSDEAPDGLREDGQQAARQDGGHREADLRAEMVFAEAVKHVDQRLSRLAHVDLEADEEELVAMFRRLDEHFKKEFAFLYGNDLVVDEKEACREAGDNITFSEDGRASAEIPESVENRLKISEKSQISEILAENKKIDETKASLRAQQILSFYTPPGDEVVDLIRRDVLYLRYIEKIFFLWLRKHLKAHAFEIKPALLEVTATGATVHAADSLGTFLGALENLRPTQLWLDQAQRWMHPEVRQSMGLVSTEDVKRMREMFRLNEDWRACALKETYEESLYAGLTSPLKERLLGGGKESLSGIEKGT